MNPKMIKEMENQGVIRDSFVFYRSFYDGIKSLSKRNQLIAFQRVESLIMGFVIGQIHL